MEGEAVGRNGNLGRLRRASGDDVETGVGVGSRDGFERSLLGCGFRGVEEIDG